MQNKKIANFVRDSMESVEQCSRSYFHLNLSDEEVKSCTLIPTTNQVDFGNDFNNSTVSCKIRNNVACLELWIN